MSTVIGNRFVENMPLNGRSFNSLIDLAPGVVLTPSNFYNQGQFSVGTARGRMQITSWSMESVRLTPPGARRLLQHLQPPQLRSTSQLHDLSPLRPATQMLGASLGAGGQTGGLNPLYQIGGPRSAQLALKLQF